MAPKATRTKVKEPYSCPLLMSPDDVKAFRESNVNLAEIATMMREVRDMTIDNHHTLRGHNGDAGMIAQFAAMEERLRDATQTLETLKTVPGDLENLKKQVDALKDVPSAIETWQRYPSLTWLVRHKFKEMSIITAGAVALTIFIGFPDHYIGERLQMLVELLFAKWLRL